MLSRSIFLIFLYFITFGIGKAQTDVSLPPYPEAGKCYAKCWISDRLVDNITSEAITYPIYTGTDPNVKTKEITIITQPLLLTWDENQNAVIDQEEIFETITVARKPRKVPSDDLVYEKIEVYTGNMYFQSGGVTEWREVLCGNQVTSNLISRLQRALIEKGYTLSDTDNTMRQETKNALVAYQENNGLPIGSLDLETLKSLDINY